MNTDPVDIIFQTNNDDLAKQAQSIVNSILGIGKSSKDSTTQVVTSFQEQEQSIEGLKSKLQTLQSQQSKLKEIMSDASKWGKVPQAITDEYNAIAKEIKEAETRIGQYSEKVNNNAQAHISLRAQIRAVKDEMAALVNTAHANNQTIDETTGRYAELKNELGRLTDIQKDVAQQANVLSNDESQFQGWISGLSGIAGGFSAATGMMSLFAGESKNLQKIETKLQAVMAISIGMQQVAQVLNKDSAFQLVIVAKAKELLAAATNKFSVSLGISNVAAKALMATLTLGLSVAIGAVIYLWDKYTSAQQKAAKEENRFSNAVVESVTKPIASITELSIKWKKLGDDLNAKKKFVKDNEDAFKDLGVSVKGVSDAENVLITNKEAFVNSQIAKARALAYSSMAAENVKKQLQLEAELAKIPETYTVAPSYGFGGSYSAGGTFKNKDYEDKKAELENLNLVIKRGYENAVIAEQNGQTYLKNAGIKAFEKEEEKNKKPKDKIIQAQEDASVKIANGDAKAALERRKVALENEQKLLDIERDGFEKSQKQLELNHKKELLNIDKHAQELLEKQQEAERLQWGKNGKNGTFIAGTTLSDDNDAEINKEKEIQKQANEAATKKLHETLIVEFGSYQEKRAKLAEEWERKIAELPAQYQGEATKQMHSALADLDSEYNHTTTAISALFGDMSKKSVGDMRAIADQAQAMMKFITDGNWDAGKGAEFGITEAQFKTLNDEWAKSPEKLAAIKKGIQELNDEADNSETAFNKMALGLKKVFSAGGDQKKLKEGLGAISDGLQSVTTMGNMFADSLRNIGKLSGSDTFSQLAEGISSVMDAANSTMQGAQAGAAFGPIGAAVGAALGLVSSITSALVAGREQAKRNAELTQQMINQQFVGEKEINALYRERYDWSKKVGETNLDYIKRVGDELQKQRAESEKDTIDYWEKLQNSTAKTTWDNGKRYGALGIDELVKDVDAGWAGAESLKGKTLEEIEKLYHGIGGQLSDDAKGWYELWLKANDEKEELLKKEEEEMQRIRELYTGTTSESIVSSIVEGFKAGKRSAADFADTFQGLMQGAMASALQLASDEKINQFYEEFANRSNDSDGLTESDVDYLNKLWDSIINNIAQETENLEKATGMKFGSDDTQQSARAGAMQSVTQDAFDLWLGQFTAIRIHTANIYEAMMRENDIVNLYLSKIEENTRGSWECLKVIMAINRKWETEGVKIV
ncbi:hypothetical protein FACS1894162_3680 [Bacteroidia bacterium]|nr:hypothetical protein FACS1894162_3680 [Bacteroidia bacterium]